MNTADKMITINIEVKDRHAVYKEAPAKLICGNAFKIIFSFDEEWTAFSDFTKKAKLVFWHKGRHQHLIIECNGNTCSVPALFGIKSFEVGIFIDDGICTTTGAVVECEKSIHCCSSQSVFGPDEIDNINKALAGHDGESAYEIAVRNGFEGTEEEWLDMLYANPDWLQDDPAEPDYIKNRPAIIPSDKYRNAIQTPDGVAYSDNAEALGKNTSAGSLGYRIVAVKDNGDGSGVYTLEKLDDNLSVGLSYSFRLTHSRYNVGQITAINGNQVTVRPYIHFAMRNDTYNYITIVGHPEFGVISIGESAHAEGINVTAPERASHGEGYNTKAVGMYSHTEGLDTLAVYGAHAEGAGGQAEGECSHVEGHYTRTKGNYAHSEGTLDPERDDLGAIGTASHNEGKNTKAGADYSHAEGYNTEVAEGAQDGHAEGYATKVLAAHGHSEGSGCEAQGQSSHAEGLNSKSIGGASHAEGAGTESRGSNSHSEGNSTKSIGAYSHAEGVYSQAKCSASHAEGYGSQTSSNEADKGQHVEGRYNDLSDVEGYAHIVGGGTTTKRKNIHTLDWEGNAWFAGSMSAKSVIANGVDLGKQLGEIETALDAILAMQNSLINGEGA